MKRALALMLSLLMLLCLFTGCGAEKAEETAPEGEAAAESGDKPLVGLCLQSMSQSIYVLMAEAMEETLADCDVQIASCDDDVSTQIQQINNFALLGAEMIVICPTEIEALTDAIQNAYESGCKILINGSTGDSGALEGYYSTCTVSDEYLIGATVGMVAKKWAETHMDPAGDWEVAFLTCSLSDDTINRSEGLKTVLNEYLMNVDGEYVDAMGNVVDEANKVPNPSYSQLIADHYTGIEVEQDMAVSNYTTVSNVMTQYPNARLFICYNSLASTEGGQYIVDNFADELDEFGFFSAGVMGSEPDYLVGSLGYEGTESVFRGAAEFGGGDVAGELAQLAYNVMYGEAGVDYAVQTPQGIGQWWAVDADWSGDGVAYLANCDIVNAVTVQDFDPIADLTRDTTTIYWDSENGYNEAAAEDTSAAAASEEPEVTYDLVVEPITAGEYKCDEMTPFNFIVYWTVTLNEDGSYSIFEENSAMGNSTYTGTEWTDNGDGTLTTGPMEGDARPMAGWFDADGVGTWGNLGDGMLVGITAESEASDEPSGEAAVAENAYLYEFDGLMGTETMQIELNDDGSCLMSLPGNVMILDVYEGTWTREGDTVTITGFTNVDSSSPYTKPGLWAWIDSATGDCVITIDEAAQTFVPVE